jgi:hypothetical protein
MPHVKYYSAENPVFRIFRMTRSLGLLSLLGLAVAVLACFPSRVRIGLAAEPVAAWWSPHRPLHVHAKNLGLVKFRRLERLRDMARSRAKEQISDGRTEGKAAENATSQCHQPAGLLPRLGPPHK